MIEKEVIEFCLSISNLLLEGAECFCTSHRRQSRDSRSFSRATHGACAFGGGSMARKYIAIATAKKISVATAKVIIGTRRLKATGTRRAVHPPFVCGRSIKQVRRC